VRGWNWISRKIFVIIIVFECSSVEIGVGFFIVDGSYGWRLNCVDFFVVVINRFISGIRLLLLLENIIC